MPPVTTSGIMRQVLLALLPGTLVLAYFFGPGVLVNVVIATAAATATEALVLNTRKQPLTTLLDGSAMLTGILLGLSLPPFLPVWMIVAGCAFAMVFGKHVYGGLGQNPFNPAMVGYAMMIVAFPLAMSSWPAPSPFPGNDAGIVELLSYKLGMPLVDGVAMATPLDAFKFRGAATVGEFLAGPQALAAMAGHGWQWVNLAFLAGGAFLLYRRVADWAMPAAMLASLVLLAALFYDGGSSRSLGSPFFHLFNGATMMAAFFVVTDPVTSPDSFTGRLVFGAGVGILTFTIRSIGAYPDGIAFAVLLMNAAAPFIDQVRWRFA
jgi:electron transport complex protein RnfD